MPRFQYIILSRAKPGRTAEFHEWYDTQHLADVLKVPGVLNGRRLDVAYQRAYGLDAPDWSSLTMYEIETDDPEAFLAHLRELSGTGVMAGSDALEKDGMIQIVARIPEQDR